MSSDLDRFGIDFNLCNSDSVYTTMVTLYWPSVVLLDCSLVVDNHAEKYDMEFSRLCTVGHGILH